MSASCGYYDCAVSQDHVNHTVSMALLMAATKLTLRTLPFSVVKSSWDALIVTHSMTSPCIVTNARRILPTVTYTCTWEHTVKFTALSTDTFCMHDKNKKPQYGTSLLCTDKQVYKKYTTYTVKSKEQLQFKSLYWTHWQKDSNNHTQPQRDKQHRQQQPNMKQPTDGL